MTQRSMFDNDQVSVTAEATHLFVELGGVEHRVWRATTETGDQVYLFGHSVGSRDELAALMKPEQTAAISTPRAYRV
jgi:hypothetical protein